MKAVRRKKRRGRPKGSGVLKFIDPAKQDFDRIERMLRSGAEQPGDESMTGECLLRLRHWRGLVEQRDDCERRIREKHKTVAEWTHRRLAGLRKEVGKAWQRLGQSLERMNAEQRSAAFAAMAGAEPQQSVFPWQEAATHLLKAYVWLDQSSGESKVLPLTPAGKAVKKCAREITATLRAGGYKVHADEKIATDMVRRFVVNKHLRMSLERQTRVTLPPLKTSAR